MTASEMSARDQRVGTSHLDRVEVESCRFGRFFENPEPSRCRRTVGVEADLMIKRAC